VHMFNVHMLVHMIGMGGIGPGAGMGIGRGIGSHWAEACPARMDSSNAVMSAMVFMMWPASRGLVG
jgi:hypothetical protein